MNPFSIPPCRSCFQDDAYNYADRAFGMTPQPRHREKGDQRPQFRIYSSHCHFSYFYQMEQYTIPGNTRIGHVHLKVSNLQQSLDFYCGLLGFELITTYGTDAAFISAGGYHHHIGLNTWQSKNGNPPPKNSTGLFHTAILYPTRKDLAYIFKRLNEASYPLTGVADHGVSEALYLDDPDKNGVELYWDRPRADWPKKSDGSIDMYTHQLDINDLLTEIQ